MSLVYASRLFVMPERKRRRFTLSLFILTRTFIDEKRTNYAFQGYDMLF